MHLPIHLDRGRNEPLQNQLFEQLRALIQSGQLKPESRIIATRFLSEQLSISRTTVLLAYERLIAEGYLETRPAIGTFVCSSLPGSGIAVRIPGPAAFSAEAARTKESIDFSFAPDNRLFPHKAWLRVTQTILDHQSRHATRVEQLSDDNGIPTLRAIISEWLAFHRGIVADPEQIVVVSGMQQALTIVAALVGLAGRPLLAERPGDWRALRLFDSLGAKRWDCPVDEAGLETRRLPDRPMALAHVTPSRQRPLGGMLPLERREELLEWASRTGASVLEDDSDGDFRYQGSALPPLFTLDRHGSVIYLRRFSDSMSPGLKLVYLVVPRPLIDSVRRIKTRLDSGTAWLEQRVLGEFIASGDYDRHLRMVRKTLLERRDALIGVLNRHFGEITLLGTASGAHLSWLLPSNLPDAGHIQHLAAARGIGLYRPLSDEPGAWFGHNILMLGYGALEPAECRRGIEILAAALSDLRPVSSHSALLNASC